MPFCICPLDKKQFAQSPHSINLFKIVPVAENQLKFACVPPDLSRCMCRLLKRGMSVYRITGNSSTSTHYPGQKKKKKRPLRLCIKSEHCSCHAVSRDWLGGAACRDFTHRCTEAQSSLIFRYPMIEQCSDFMHNRSGHFFFGQGSTFKLATFDH